MTRLSRLSPLFLPSLLLALLLATACDRLPNPAAAGTPTAAPLAGPTPTLPPAATASAVQPPLPAAPLSPLRVWVPNEIGARTAGGAEELNNQLRAFETAHRQLDVVVEQKPVEGPGGIVSYLRTGRAVAPSILPDLIALPTTTLADPSVRELLFPLEGHLDPALLEDTYPALAAQSVSDNRLYGFPFAVSGLPHLIYRPSVVSDTLPLSWPVFISDTNHTLILPADSRDGALWGLQFYLAEGGSLADDAGKPALQAEPLTRALEQIALNKANLLQSRQLKTLDEAWQYYQLGLSDSVWTRSGYVLAQLTPATADIPPADLAYGRVPGPRGALTPLVTSWAWAITATDPARQELAAELIQSLTTPENLATWSRRNQMLPARREAMAVLAERNAYFEFAGAELERAALMPISESGRLLDVLGDAVFQVLATETAPATLAEDAAAALRQ